MHFISDNLRFKPPSKRIIPTEIDMKGWRRFPKRRSGFIRLNIGPARIPNISNKSIEGIFMRLASQVAVIPRKKTSPNISSGFKK